MKRFIVFIVFLVILFLSNIVIAAANPEIQAVVVGKIESGQVVEIFINVKDIKNLYAADMQYNFDPAVLKVKGVEKGGLISEPGIGIIPLTNNIDLQKGIVRYNFTCLGEVSGFSGSGTFLKMTAEVLKDANLYINSKDFAKAPDHEYNLWMQLVDKDLKDIEYKFIPYGSIPSQTETNTSQSGESFKNSSSNGSTDSSGKENPGSLGSESAAGSSGKPTGHGSQQVTSGQTEKASQQDTDKEQPVSKQAIDNSKQIVSPQSVIESEKSNTDDKITSQTEYRTSKNAYIIVAAIMMISALVAICIWRFANIRKINDKQKNKNISI
jgi:hypothetical protein